MLALTPKEAKVVKRVGSGFLISESGGFVTAAHVLAEMQKEDDPCLNRTAALGATGDADKSARQ